MCINDNFCRTLSKLLNDKLSLYLLKFLEDIEASGILKNSDSVAQSLARGVGFLKQHTEPRARILTLHVRLRDTPIRHTNMFEFIKALTLEGVRPLDMTYEEMVQVHDCVKVANGLIPYMVDRIEARQKSDYENFQIELIHLDDMVTNLRHRLGADSGAITFSPISLSSMVDANREMFYSYREPERYTSLGPIIRKGPDLRTIEKGLEYAIRCDIDKIPLMNRSTL